MAHFWDSLFTTKILALLSFEATGTISVSATSSANHTSLARLYTADADQVRLELKA